MMFMPTIDTIVSQCKAFEPGIRTRCQRKAVADGLCVQHHRLRAFGIELEIAGDEAPAPVKEPAPALQPEDGPTLGKWRDLGEPKAEAPPEPPPVAPPSMPAVASRYTAPSGMHRIIAVDPDTGREYVVSDHPASGNSAFYHMQRKLNGAIRYVYDDEGFWIGQCGSGPSRSHQMRPR